VVVLVIAPPLVIVPALLALCGIGLFAADGPGQARELPATGGVWTRAHMLTTRATVAATWPNPPSAADSEPPHTPAAAEPSSPRARTAVDTVSSQ